jgi:hypothetical protein
MPRKSAEFVELEKKYEEALKTIEAISRNQAMLTAQFGASRPTVPSGQLVVGIRNISNYTVGLIDTTSGIPVEYSLSPEIPGVSDPRTRAVVSYAFWQKLRVSSQVSNGLIMRDDSVLGEADNVAPADRPKDIPAGAEVNRVLDPREWIVSKSEDEIRDAIAKMTSGPTLRRLMYAVDQEIVNLGEPFIGAPDRAVKALRALPGKFRLVDELATERLDELNPVAKVRHLERGDLVAGGAKR